MRPGRAASLVVAAASMASAQIGTVQNAALQLTAIPYAAVYFSLVPINGAVSGIFGNFSGFNPNPNIISPRMLAVLTYAAPETIAVLGTFPTYPQPQPVNAALFIRPAGTGNAIPVIVTNADTGSVTFVVPAGVPLGGAELLYQINGGPTQWTPVNVVQSSFGFFSNAGGPAIAQSIAQNGMTASVGLTTPIQPGQTLLLTGSGLGYGSTVSASIGGAAAPVVYAGPSGTQVGHDEILLQVPAGVAAGCYVPVAFTYNKTVVTTTVSVTSNGAPCVHPWQLSLNDMKTLDSGGYLASAEIDLSTNLGVVTAAAGSRSESADMSVSEINAATLAGYFAPSVAPAGCNVATSGESGIFLVNGIFGAGTTPTPPDIGSTATLTNPTTSIVLTNDGVGYYATSSPLVPTDGPLNNLPAPAIAGGKWTFQSGGGTDLGASSFIFSLPAPIQLSGGVPVMINHIQDQTISWNGAAFDAGATAFITLGGNSVVSCTIPANAGTVTIPAAMLSGFPANTIGTLTIRLNEEGAYLPHTEFQLNNKNSLLVFVPFASSDTRPVFFQ